MRREEILKRLENAERELAELRILADGIRKAGSGIIDALVLQGHDFQEPWERLLVFCGRYCLPFTSFRANAALVSGGSIDQAAEIARLRAELSNLRAQCATLDIRPVSLFPSCDEEEER